MVFVGWEQNYKALYPHHYDGPHFDWPSYRPVQETPEQVAHVRYEYAASPSMCDEYLGKVLVPQVEHDLWDDTALVQTIDLPATLLELFGIALPPDMQGVPLREATLYGLHGGHVNVTDRRYTYMRAPVEPENTPLYNYTLHAHARPVQRGGIAGYRACRTVPLYQGLSHDENRRSRGRLAKRAPFRHPAL